MQMNPRNLTTMPIDSEGRTGPTVADANRCGRKVYAGPVHVRRQDAAVEAIDDHEIGI